MNKKKIERKTVRKKNRRKREDSADFSVEAGIIKAILCKANKTTTRAAETSNNNRNHYCYYDNINRNNKSDNKIES